MEEQMSRLADNNVMAKERRESSVQTSQSYVPQNIPKLAEEDRYAALRPAEIDATQWRDGVKCAMKIAGGVSVMPKKFAEMAHKFCDPMQHLESESVVQTVDTAAQIERIRQKQEKNTQRIDELKESLIVKNTGYVATALELIVGSVFLVLVYKNCPFKPDSFFHNLLILLIPFLAVPLIILCVWIIAEKKSKRIPTKTRLEFVENRLKEISENKIKALEQASQSAMQADMQNIKARNAQKEMELSKIEDLLNRIYPILFNDSVKIQAEKYAALPWIQKFADKLAEQTYTSLRKINELKESDPQEKEHRIEFRANRSGISGAGAIVTFRQFNLPDLPDDVKAVAVGRVVIGEFYRVLNAELMKRPLHNSFDLTLQPLPLEKDAMACTLIYTLHNKTQKTVIDWFS